MTDETMKNAPILPDGSSFFTASMPLPADHWLYAPSCGHWDTERDCLGDTPQPILGNEHRAKVIAAIRWAVRGATMNGKQKDFDPDALVLNAAYALCGPIGSPPQAGRASAAPVPAELVEALKALVIDSDYDPNSPPDSRVIQRAVEQARAFFARQEKGL